MLDPRCPTRQRLDRIGTKWTSMTVKVLAEEHPHEVRFAQLRHRVPGISQKMLSATLQSLARDGLVARRVEPTVPPAVHYRLTELGLSLEEPLSVLRLWAETHMPEQPCSRPVLDALRVSPRSRLLGRRRNSARRTARAVVMR
ncbi:helix-turn-helix domain-containing protein [Streptomyces sp. NPDC013172]|uniref:winged helix-turn-helix transcriptional regulator n=1 Tax=Streptomyces sp. NPDC013172 TaxID=3155009 RepID=UPI0033CB4601